MEQKELAQKIRRIHNLRRIIKRREEQLEAAKQEAQEYFDSIVNPRVEDYSYPLEMFENSTDLNEYITHTMPHMEVIYTKYEEDAWHIGLRPKRRYVKAQVEVDDFVLERTISNRKPKIDLEKLKEIDPQFFGGVTMKKEVIELDEELLEAYIHQFPGAITTLEKVIVSEPPTPVLRVSQKKDI